MTAELQTTNVVRLRAARPPLRPRRLRSRGRLKDPLALIARGAVRGRACSARRQGASGDESDGDRTSRRQETIGSVSHELRTPLTSVVGYTEMVLNGDVGPLNGEQTLMLARVGDNAARLFSLIEELLSAAQKCVDAQRSVDVVDLVGEVVGPPTTGERPRAAKAWPAP